MAGIYIHIPFCRKLCNYCDFYHVIYKGDNRPYIEAVIREAETRREYLGDEKVTTIYVGGGTPSVFSVKDLASVVNASKRIFPVEPGYEATIELNPDDISTDYMKGLLESGFNRVSFGVQSWRDEDLKFLNRRHTAAQAAKALEDTFRAGFVNVGIDLIYGIPGMNVADWSSNLDKTFSFDIKHLSAYHLTIEPGTSFGRMKDKGLLNEIDEEESAAQFYILVEKTGAARFIHYEISNFGKPGYFSVHNINYWKQVPYIGLGPSAHSFNGYSRQWNISDLNKYIKFVNEGKPYFKSEELNIKKKFNEYILVSLRTMWGMDLDYIESSFEKEGYDYVVNLAGKYIGYGLMKKDKKNLVLTNQGKMISDNIISEFMMPDDD